MGKGQIVRTKNRISNVSCFGKSIWQMTRPKVPVTKELVVHCYFKLFSHNPNLAMQKKQKTNKQKKAHLNKSGGLIFNE